MCNVSFFKKYIYFNEIQLTSSVSGAQQGGSVIQIYIYIYILFLKFFSIIGYDKILTMVPYATQ